MRLKDAWKKGLGKICITMGKQGLSFSPVGLVNPTNGQRSGPYLVTVSGGAAIEVSYSGNFLNMLSGDAENYFPWDAEELMPLVGRSAAEKSLDAQEECIRMFGHPRDEYVLVGDQLVHRSVR